MLQGPRILIADDSDAIIAQLSSICRDIFETPEILTAKDLRTSRAMLGRRPDVVFLDIRLSGGENGLDLLWDIGRSLVAARVITMTGLPSDDVLVKAAQAIGMHAHLEKPLRREAVRAALGPLAPEKAK